MCRTPDASLYADARNALSVVTGRPTSIVPLGDDTAVRVEFEYSRYLLAVVDAHGRTDSDQWTRWHVTINQKSDGAADSVIAEATSAWLIDAYDAAIAEVPDDDLGMTPSRDDVR
ncbi:hypothetical protein [Gordonia soli]|uniref:Uncharacterized protein n=1 Tax=Gordonia soli NBRC 108243 TaxID=1223545 RepID=M0QNH2_9ACTN|nr:hypothetical protein [Gordonia soli]GAC69949.1 hypothetical protein GS4_30_00200 [Gordonia soli NBRC 108243]